MSKYFQTALVLFYVLLVAFCIQLLLTMCGVHISNTVSLFATAGWLLYCFSSVYVKPDYFLLGKQDVRLPILPEEEKLNPCLYEVLQRASVKRLYRLMIIEDMNLNAAAIGKNTIAVSRGVMEKMTDGEIKAVIAHELGHHVSYDCVVVEAFKSASEIPMLVTYIYKKILRILLTAYGFSIRIMAGISLLLGVAVLIGFGYLLYKYHLIQPLLSLAIFVLIFVKITPGFMFAWTIISRFTEYRQDAFAHRLGYGPNLRTALHKLAEGPVQPVNLHFILHHSDHPLVYNRIRRLERLEGLR